MWLLISIFCIILFLAIIFEYRRHQKYYQKINSDVNEFKKSKVLFSRGNYMYIKDYNKTFKLVIWTTIICAILLIGSLFLYKVNSVFFYVIYPIVFYFIILFGLIYVLKKVSKKNVVCESKGFHLLEKVIRYYPDSIFDKKSIKHISYFDGKKHSTEFFIQIPKLNLVVYYYYVNKLTGKFHYVEYFYKFDVNNESIDNEVLDQKINELNESRFVDYLIVDEGLVVKKEIPSNKFQDDSSLDDDINDIKVFYNELVVLLKK